LENAWILGKFFTDCYVLAKLFIFTPSRADEPILTVRQTRHVDAEQSLFLLCANARGISKRNPVFFIASQL
jgi:hypothetical protein